jgi:general secretion pathway protein D
MKKYILILLMIFSIGSITFGVTVKNLPKSKFEEDIDFNETKLSDALALMSKVTGVTMVADSEVKDLEINLYINKSQRLREVLDIIKVTNELEEVYIGNVIMLTKSGKDATTFMGKIIDSSGQGISGVRVTLGDSGYTPIRTQVGGVFVYDNIRSGVYIVKLEKIGYTTSSEVVDVKQNRVTNMDIYLEKRNKEGAVKTKREEGIRKKDLGSSKNEDGIDVLTERIQLKHAFADDVKNVVDSILGETVGITAFPKLHMLVIKGKKDNVDIAKQLIDDLDRPTKQVRITAQVLDTTDNLFEDLGFNWLFSNKASDVNAAEPGSSVGLLPANILGVVSGSSAINFVDIFNDGKNLLDVSMTMLQNTEDLSISSVPSVVIVNGEQAEFKVTEEVIVGEREESDDDNNRVKEPIFEEAGTIFTVTPTIREGIDEPDTIILEIDSEVSDFKLTKEGTYNNKGGSKIQSNITTKIQVHDGDVIFIGGLKKTTVKETENKVPILGDVPVLGTFFRNTSTSNNVRQVYIQITAEIVSVENANTSIDISKFKKNSATTGKLKRIYPDFDESDENKPSEGL